MEVHFQDEQGAYFARKSWYGYLGLACIFLEKYGFCLGLAGVFFVSESENIVYQQLQIRYEQIRTEISNMSSKVEKYETWTPHTQDIMTYKP